MPVFHCLPCACYSLFMYKHCKFLAEILSFCSSSTFSMTSMDVIHQVIWIFLYSPHFTQSFIISSKGINGKSKQHGWSLTDVTLIVFSSVQSSQAQCPNSLWLKNRIIVASRPSPSKQYGWSLTGVTLIVLDSRIRPRICYSPLWLKSMK